MMPDLRDGLELEASIVGEVGVEVSCRRVLREIVRFVGYDGVGWVQVRIWYSLLARGVLRLHVHGPHNSNTHSGRGKGTENIKRGEWCVAW